MRAATNLNGKANVPQNEPSVGRQKAQDTVDQVNATILELRDEVEEKKQRNVALRKMLLQKDALLAVKDARITELEGMLPKKK